jgi:pterin-4a-carbinolamine dehydratase
LTTHERKSKSAAEVVDLTNGDALADKGKEECNDSFSTAGANIPYFMFSETDTPNTKEQAAESQDECDEESDNEVEFLGCNNEKKNASIVQSDTSSEYDEAVGFSQEVFTRSAYIPHLPDARRRSNRNLKGKSN